MPGFSGWRVGAGGHEPGGWMPGFSARGVAAWGCQQGAGCLDFWVPSPALLPLTGARVQRMLVLLHADLHPPGLLGVLRSLARVVVALASTSQGLGVGRGSLHLASVFQRMRAGKVVTKVSGGGGGGWGGTGGDPPYWLHLPSAEGVLYAPAWIPPHVCGGASGPHVPPEG